jgi:hypothetical protein
LNSSHLSGIHIYKTERQSLALLWLCWVKFGLPETEQEDQESWEVLRDILGGGEDSRKYISSHEVSEALSASSSGTGTAYDEN